MTLYLILMGIPFILGLWAQSRVKSAFSKYSQVRASSNISGADAARDILRAAQIDDVEVVEINGMLGDHYDPSKKRLCLSSDVYRTPSVAALGIAAHESGHAIQHARAYAPLKARMALVPITMFASHILPYIFLAGFVLRGFHLLEIATFGFLILTVFQLITLPVEFDASRRAKVILGQMGMISPGDEAAGVNRVLNAAALTYVATFVASLAQFIYFFLASRRS